VRVLRLAWLGIAAREYEPTVEFFRSVMGLRVEFEEPGTTELSLPDDDRVQVLAPGHAYFKFFQNEASGPVPLFEVDDLAGAHAELEAAGIRQVGEIDRDSMWEWLHFRAPDGNLYALGSRR
jgi:catechol 2,3-dioxygenase-like lactoylglutathione lyase family enzyme